MINSLPPPMPDAAAEDTAVDAIIRTGPSGAIVVAGLATVIVVALWFAFYVFVFLPRGALQ